MIDRLSPVGGDRPLVPVPNERLGAPARPAEAPPVQTPREHDSAGLPAEVLDSLDSAQRVLADLRARHIELRYVVDDKSKKVHAQLVRADGSVLREIPARHALDLLAGERVFDALG